MNIPPTFDSVEEEIAYFKRVATEGQAREVELETMISEQKALEQSQRRDLVLDLNVATERSQAYQRKWELAKQQLEIISSKQVALTSSSNKELVRLQDNCSRLEIELEKAKILVREMEQANEKYQERERAAIASLEEAERSIEALRRESISRNFELEVARNVISQMEYLNEENLNLKSDIEHYKMRLSRQEEEVSSTYDVESVETWENEPTTTKASPGQVSVSDWVDQSDCPVSPKKLPAYRPKRSSMLRYDEPQL